jgi:hypothetical protein
MNILRSSRSGRALLLGLLGFGLTQCRTSAPVAPAVSPAAVVAPGAPATAQRALVGSLVTAAPAKIVADLDALSRRLDLPMMLGQQVKSSLAGLGLLGDQARFQAIWERLDPAARVAVVWVVPPQKQEKGYCAALTFRDAAGAQQTFAGMGTSGEQRSGIASRRTPGGDVLWGSVRGRTLFVSGSPEALLLGSALAEAAQTAPAAGQGQVVITVLPQALIAASGKTREVLLSELVARADGEIKRTPSFGTLAAQRFASALAATGAKLALDASLTRLVLDVGEKDGLAVQAELVPLAGTGFATGIARRAPFAFDRKLPVRDDSTVVTAMGEVSAWLSHLAKLFAATGTAGQAMQKEMDRYFGWIADSSCVADATPAGLASLCSWGLKGPSAPTTAVFDAVVALLEAEVAWEGELYGGRKLSPLKIKRSADLLEIEKKLEQPDLQAQAISKALAGGEAMHSAFAVKSGRLVMATGRDARKLLEHYGTGGDLAAAPLVAAALAKSKGAEAMLSLDIVSLVLRTLGQGKGVPGAEIAMAAQIVPGLSEMKAPFLFALRGGNSLTGELRLPLGSLENIAKVVRGMLGPASAP